MSSADRASVRLLFIEQYYYPEGWGGAEIPRDVTARLARSGFLVSVVCGGDQYAPVEGREVLDPGSAGVSVRRSRRLFPGDVQRWKLPRQLWFYCFLIRELLLSRAPDIYVAQTNPPLGVVVAAFAARVRRRKYVIVAQDLYPEVLIAYGMLGETDLPTRILRAVFEWAYRAADRVVALGPCMRQRILDKGVDYDRVVVVPNWSTGNHDRVERGENPLVRDWGLVGAFVVLYSGNVGIGHEFETLLDGFAAAAPNCPAMRLVIIGKGSRLADVRRAVAARGLQVVTRFEVLVPADRLPHTLGLAHLALVTLRPGFEGLMVPSKALGYMARGIPMLYVGPDSDISALVEKSGCGYAVRNGASEAVAAVLIDAYRDREGLQRRGAAGHSYYEAHLGRERSLAGYVALLRDLTAGGGHT
jgi:glycosyltransferase involved in cell wall biosynthesis